MHILHINTYIYIYIYTYTYIYIYIHNYVSLSLSLYMYIYIYIYIYIATVWGQCTPRLATAVAGVAELGLLRGREVIILYIIVYYIYIHTYIMCNSIIIK